MFLPSAISFVNFRFVQVTDTHGGRHEPGNRVITNLVQELIELDPKPAFVICTGDFVETGLDWEYDKYMQLLKPLEAAQIPIYHVPGNHETRWATKIKKDYTDRLGPTYFHFKYHGHHFLLLDTSFVPESVGHIESEQLRWLDDKLKNIGSTDPVWVFSHHPLGYRSRFIDNDMEAVDLLLSKNFIMGMFGHDHSHWRWQIRDREFFMSKGCDGSYGIVDVEKSRATVLSKQVGKEARVAFTVPISTPKRAQVSFNSNYSLTIYEAEAFRIIVTPTVELEQIEVKLGAGNWQRLIQTENSWGGSIIPQYVGTQTLWIRGTLAGQIYQQQKQVEVLPSKSEQLPKVLWVYKTDGSIFSSPAEDEQYVYFGSHDGVLYALDKTTGEPGWICSTAGPILSSPQVCHGVVYFASGNGKVYSVDSSSGGVLWSRDQGDPIIASPAVVEDRVYIGGPEAFFCLDKATGALLWQYQNPGLIKVRPVVHEGKVYFTSWSRYVTCLDAKIGKKLWEREIDSSFFYAPATGNPAVYEGQLIITTPKHIVMSLDLKTGQELWRTEQIKAGYCSPTIWRGKVLLTTLDGKLVALDGKDGSLLWTSCTGEGIYDAGVAVDDAVGITNTCHGSLVAFDCSTGDIFWKKKLSDAFIFTIPSLSEGVVYVGSTDDHFYAVQYK